MKQTLHLDCRATRADGSGETLRIEIDLNPALLAATLELLREMQTQASGCQPGLLAHTEACCRAYAKRVGTDRSVSSLRKYAAAAKHLAHYVRTACGRNDLPLSEVDADFVRGYRAFLQGELGFAPGTARLYLSAFKHCWHRAQAEGCATHDPFADTALPAAPPQRFALTLDELSRLRALPLRGMDARVRDLFVWAAMTGLSFTDIRSLRPADVEFAPDGAGWLTKRRRKTGQTSVVRLTAEAAALLRHLPKRPEPEGWLQVPDNRTVNRHLRRLGERIGTRRKLHFHTARHTFATLLLTAGVPIETVSTMLGHARIATTQIYAEVTRRKIQQDTMRMTSAFSLGSAPAL